MTKKMDSKSSYVFAEMAIGSKKDKYIDIFKRITQGNFIIPSLWAGIFGLGWLIYRRAAFYGFIAYVFLIFLAYNVVELFDFSKDLKLLAIFGFTHIVFYFLGNFIYWYSVRQKVDDVRDDFGDTSAMTHLGAIGGTTFGVSLIASVVLLQGGMVLLVYGMMSADVFFSDMWRSILELANFKDSLGK